jgi:hypothetical protein
VETKIVKVRVLGNTIDYVGTQLKPMFVYAATQGKANIVIFRGEMSVDTKNMVDFEDVVANDTIRSADAINILAELPFTNLVGGVALQRIMIRRIAESIQEHTTKKVLWAIQGDDIKFCLPRGSIKKLSVSIATATSTSILIHIGINIRAGWTAPHFAGSLADLGKQFNNTKFINQLMTTMGDRIEDELNDIYAASMKVLPK